MRRIVLGVALIVMSWGVVACGTGAGAVQQTPTASPSVTQVPPAATVIAPTATSLPPAATIAPPTATPPPTDQAPASPIGPLPPCCKPLVTPGALPPTPAGVNPASTAVPPPPGQPGTIAAPIDAAEVRAAGSSYVLHVNAGLPSGCAKQGGYDVVRSGVVFKVTVTDIMTSSGPCTMIYGMYQLDIPLPGDFVAGTTYTVQVNEKSVSFTAK